MHRISWYCWIALMLSSLIVKAQYPELNWAKNIGSTSTDNGLAVTSDAAGNIFVTGFFAGTVDFDPGAGIVNLTAAGSTDIFVTKFNAAGNLVWAKRMGGTQQDVGTAITVDASSNILLTGYFRATADFDPGTGVANFTSAGEDDIFVCKLDFNGDYQWAYAVGGISFDRGGSIAVSSINDVAVTGTFRQTVDFDPGPGTSSFTNVGLDDSFIVKLNGSNGTLQWAKQFDCQARGISIDLSNNILTTGAFSGTVDFDPGAGIFTLTGIANEAFVLKLEDDGDFVWATGMGGNSDDVGQAIKTDPTGDVYTTGYFVHGDGSPHDFDPGAGVFNLTPVSDTNPANSDIYVSKLSSTGAFIWAKQLGGIGTEQPFSLTLDAFGNVYTSGTFGGMVDFDPSASIYSFTSNGFSNIYISKLNSSGDFVWAEKPDGSYSGFGRGIHVDNANQVIVTGSFDTTVDFSAGSCEFNLTSNGSSDIFIQKLSQTGVPPPTITNFNPVVGLAGTVITLTGFNFDPTPSNNSVEFNGMPAVVTASTATSITTSVPVGATTGFITVSVGCPTGVSSNPYKVATCMPASQRNALIELYNTTNGSSWNNNTNWLSADESTWFGITVSGCNVTGIDLPGNNLNGYLSPDLGLLSDLIILNLSDNSLYDGIPPELGNLSNLQYLQLNDNFLQYNVPVELENLTSLIEVSLNNNRLAGSAPAIGLASMNMSDVYLEGNSFNGLNDITGYYNLNSFWIGTNFLTFEDLEPNASVSGFQYSPQAKLPPGGVVSFVDGGTLTIPFTTPGTANNYQWYKDGILIPGATSPSYSKASANASDAGTYLVQVTNGIATNVTLQSYDFVAAFDPCTSATRVTGFIDATFNTAIDNPATVNGVAVQNTGKIIVSIVNTTIGGTPVDGTIRLNADGTLDGTFNQIPEYTIPLIQADNKILGYASDQVIRYDADGIDDFTFNNNAPQSYTSTLYAMALQPDGKIVYSNDGYMGIHELRRLNTDGTNDSSFPVISLLAGALEVQADGKILVAGALSPTLGRLNDDGSTDFSFAVSIDGFISDILVQPDGKILAVGTFTQVQGANRFGIVRLNANGSLDNTFNAVGFADLFTYFGPRQIARASNGQLIVAGEFTSVNGAVKKNLVKLNIDGTVDCSFSPGLSTNSAIKSMALQSDNAILIAGDFVSYDGNTRYGLAQVLNDQATITISPQPTASVVCAGANTSFAIGASGTTNISYQWQFSPDGVVPFLDISNTGGYSNVATATLLVNTTGNFGGGFYRCKVNGDLASTTFSNAAQLTVNTVPTAPITTGGSGCSPSASITLNASGASAGQYRWYTTATGGSPIAGQTNSTFITPLISTTTTFYVSISNGTCEGIRSPVIATIQTCANPPVIAAQPQVTQTEQKIVVNVTGWLSDSDDNLNLASLRIITQPSSGATASLATNGDLTIDYAGVLFAGPDVLRIEVCDLTGLCSQEDITIEVAGDIIVYNALSPNGDDKNPTLLLKYIDILSSTKTNTVSVYNRWGDEVFSVSDYDNKTRVFEGLTSDGNKLPVGIYFYKISLPDAGKTLTGFISLKY